MKNETEDKNVDDMYRSYFKEAAENFNNPVYLEKCGRVVSEYDQKYAEKVVKHLAENYDKGVWEGSIIGEYLTREDISPILERYKEMQKVYQGSYEKNLNKQIVDFLTFQGSVTSKEFIGLIKYKLISKPKRKIAHFLWSKDDNIYYQIRKKMFRSSNDIY